MKIEGEIEEIWYHVDVNSTFLSWTAVHEIHIKGSGLDLRTIPSATGGNEKEGYGIALAKSGPAKKYGISAGESLYEARCKCSELVILPPDYELYVECSKAPIRLLRQYLSHVHQCSTDETFCLTRGTTPLRGNPVVFMHQFREEIRNILGFTANIGVSDHKLLARMISELRKPDKVHVLSRGEIQKKMWSLLIGDSFQVGRTTRQKPISLGTRTIGELAISDPELIIRHLKKHGGFIWNYASGRDTLPFLKELPENRGYGDSMTIPSDMTDAAATRQVVLPLTKTVCAGPGAGGMKVACVTIFITDRDFIHCSRQTTLISATGTTLEIYRTACRVFDSLQNRSPIRQMGAYTNRVTRHSGHQYNMFDTNSHKKYPRLDAATDEIREKYGKDSVMRVAFLGQALSHMGGGIDKAKRTGMAKASRPCDM